jgi:hypothetical protein
MSRYEAVNQIPTELQVLVDKLLDVVRYLICLQPGKSGALYHIMIHQDKDLEVVLGHVRLTHECPLLSARFKTYCRCYRKTILVSVVHSLHRDSERRLVVIDLREQSLRDDGKVTTVA